MANRIGLKLKYEVEVRDKDGKLLAKISRQSKSLVGNFMRWLRQWFTIAAASTYATAFSMNDVGNVGRTFPNATTGFQSIHGIFSAGAGVDTWGMVVGTSNQAVSPNDYNLVAKIAQGSGAGQLVHNAQSIEALTIVDQVSSFRNTRTFTNNSGGAIVVREIGLIFVQRDSGSTERFVLAIRDVLVSPQSVPDGATLTVRYTLSATA